MLPTQIDNSLIKFSPLLNFNNCEKKFFLIILTAVFTVLVLYQKKLNRQNPPISTPTPQIAAEKYLNAYITQDWPTVKKLCSDPNFNQDIAQNYNFVGYGIAGWRVDSDPNRYHFYIGFTDKNGKRLNHKANSEDTLEIDLVKNKQGNWLVSTWQF
jgi:hypothetical protein